MAWVASSGVLSTHVTGAWTVICPNQGSVGPAVWTTYLGLLRWTGASRRVVTGFCEEGPRVRVSRASFPETGEELPGHSQAGVRHPP